ncbi:MAG: hypothetical protein ACREIA_04490 [Opitutaceae bacterium]
MEPRPTLQDIADFVQTFPWASFTSVGCHVGYYQPPVNVVVPDFHHAIVRAWKEALAAGYKRIGAAMLREMQAVDLFDKVSAALYCQARVTPELRQIPVAHFPMDDESEFKAWMKEHKPDVVLGFNATVCAWLDPNGYNVPKDVAFASLDCPPEARHRGLRVSGMNPDYALIGRTAIEQRHDIGHSGQEHQEEKRGPEDAGKRQLVSGKKIRGENGEHHAADRARDGDENRVRDAGTDEFQSEEPVLPMPCREVCRQPWITHKLRVVLERNLKHDVERKQLHEQEQQN